MRSTKFRVCLVAAILALSVSSGAQDRILRRASGVLLTPASVSTTFPLTENPISESNQWVGGATVGLLWSDFATTTNKAFGTQTEGAHNGTTGYNDSVACRRAPAGTYWADNQDIRGRIYITSRSGWTGFHEVELWARCSVIANEAKAYEAIFSTNGGSTYYEIVRWNGPLGIGGCTAGCAFTSLNFVTCTGVDDGTYVRFTAVGNVLTQYTSSDGSSWSVACGGTATVTDSTYTSGMPGMGHWTNGAGNPNTYGLSQWSAQ